MSIDIMSYSNKVVQPSVFLIVIQSPCVITVVLNFVFGRDKSLTYNQIIITVMMALSACVISYIFCITVEHLNEQVDNQTMFFRSSSIEAFSAMQHW